MIQSKGYQYHFIIIVMSTNGRPLLDKGILKGVQNITVLCRLGPAAPYDSPDVIRPPFRGSTNAAFTDARSPLQHFRILVSIGSTRHRSYVPRPPQLCTLAIPLASL
ncbi:jg10709 [Pararge aegeria aegeria]|uniref:Jg10709 protein n=1 Tax=Pararge aegeria aegeria TaxID=348720 RepID=A0A8S4RH26_9NEOP|nr:jg10709 [Pararge aegeria aegeria]